MMKKDTIYWRCIQFRAFRCPARHRQNRATGLLELVHSEHNHEQIQTRRKRGTLKELMRQRIMNPTVKNVSFIRSKRGAIQLHVNGYFYTKDKTRNNITFWSCTQARVYCCAARASSVSTVHKKGTHREKVILRGDHNHPIVTERRKPGKRAQLILDLHRKRTSVTNEHKIKKKS